MVGVCPDTWRQDLITLFKLVLALLVSAGTGSLISYVGQPNSENIVNFGDVEPGSRMEAEFEIVNSGNEILTLGGLEDACGVEVTISGNGIILPGKTGVLRLGATAVQRRGPGGAGFDLVRTIGNLRAVENYRLGWNVTGDSWASPSEIWLGVEGAHVTIRNSTPGTQIVVRRVPERIAFTVSGSRVDFTASGRLSPGRVGDVWVDLIHNRRTIKRFVIPLYQRDPGSIRFYPSERFALRSNAIDAKVLFYVVGEVPEGCYITASGPLANKALLNNNQVILQPDTVLPATGSSEVVMLSAKNEPMASATVRFGE